MPKIDGWQASRIIRSSSQKKFSRIPIFAMVANSMIGDELGCINAGMNAYLSKPLDLSTLQKLISEHIFRKAS